MIPCLFYQAMSKILGRENIVNTCFTKCAQHQHPISQSVQSEGGVNMPLRPSAVLWDLVPGRMRRSEPAMGASTWHGEPSNCC